MKRYLTLVMLSALSCIAIAQQAPDGFYYQKYFSYITVHEDNSYDIREVMEPFFTEPRHGLYRTIPTSIWIKRDVSEAQDRSDTLMCHYNTDVDIDYCSANYLVESAEGVKDIRIGSADQWLEGNARFVLDYKMQLPEDRVPQADLFFHSVIGTGNPCTIEKAAFRIYFDKPLSQESMDRIAVYKGREGDTINYARQVLIECTPDSLTGWVENLEPYEGLSVYVPMPEGYFSAPESSYVFWAKLWSVLSCALLIYVIYREVIRSNHVTKVLTFYPPKEVSSAEVGTLFDCSADDCDLISLIPWFANFGYISISKTKGGSLVLRKLKELPDDAPKHQLLIFEALFPNGSTEFFTSHQTSTKFGKAWLKAKDTLNEENSKHFDEFEYGMFFILLLGLLFGAIAIGLGDADPDAGVTGLVTLVCYTVEAIVMSMFAGNVSNNKGCFMALLSLFVVLFAFSGPMVMITKDLYINHYYIDAVMILGFVASLFTHRLYYMTEYRRKRMGEILGLQEFIRTADIDRLKLLLTDDGQYFYKVLPYAIAFGLADRWAKQFENLTIQPTEHITASISDLNYVSHFMDHDNIRHGVTAEKKRVAEAAERARAAAARSRASSGSSYSSSRSYSSGGGGYSGGGSGGGGSRSW